MSEYDEIVEKQRQILAAEEWALGVKSMHAHSMSSMWYDDRPQDTENGKGVVDTEFNNGLIERKQEGVVIHYFGEKLEGQALLDQWRKHN
tara:strand:- start:3767 stop:4036 length:270 start_codon:yes stop_codon:yes gene_type:complete